MLNILFCVGFWTIIFSFIFHKAISGLSQAINHVKRLHQIPCSKCAYFTGDYRLKCPVNPMIALSESAINCRDFSENSELKFNNFQTSENSNCIQS